MCEVAYRYANVMETAGEERVRAAESLRKLEEAALLLEEASKSQSTEKVSAGYPERVSSILNSLTAVSSRDDAERLLATGVSMWNSTIAFEAVEQSQNLIEPLVKIRHVAVDCMYMSTTVLGGISARYNIDDLSLLKFYTACGQKYANDLSDMEMAEVCFSRAAEFVERAVNESRTEDGEKKHFSSAMFDLLLGRAECAWDKGDSDQAERFVSDARRYMDDLSGEHEFLASVEYNFGLFAYQAKETERALKWLKRSMETRGSEGNSVKDLRKQARTARLAGVCLLALQEYEESWEMMKSGEDLFHDPVGSYLLLKLSIINKKPEARDILVKIIGDVETSLDICLAAIALFGDSQRIADAAVGYEHLFARFRDDPEALVNHVGLRYFETLAALGKIDDALGVLDVCRDSFANVKMSYRRRSGDGNERDGTEDELQSRLSRWSSLLLATGCAQADRKNFANAAKLLHSCLLFSSSNCSGSCVVLENEAAVCRLAASCALCALDDLKKATKVAGIDRDDLGGSDNNFTQIQRELYESALRHSQRAKCLEPSDFTPRLLLFRAYLEAGEIQKAADELRVASAEIRTFDPGALAEAACTAKDLGSLPSVVAALRCVLKMDPTALFKSVSATSSNVPKGFFGKVLLSCIHITLEADKTSTSPANQDAVKDYCIDEKDRQKMAGDLPDILSSGLRGLQKLGIEKAFDKKKDDVNASITFLTNVCWNKGRERGMKLDYHLWETFFDLCFQFSSFLPSDAGNLHTQRMAKLMCASANVENPDSGEQDFRRAREQVMQARRLSQELRELSPSSGGDPIEGLLLILEARCCIGTSDIDALASVIEIALKEESITASVLEQLAAVCYNDGFNQSASRSNDRARCIDFTAAVLSNACDARLCENPCDMGAIAITIREQLGIELARGSTAARAYKVFTKAIGIVVENSDEYPMDERRWLVATGWDRAQMFKRLGLRAEARRWCEGVKQMAEGCAALSAYVPRIDSMMTSL